MRGDCGQQVAMYTYDSVSSSCVRFMYSGCDGNANRFETRAMCEVACERYMIAYEQTTPHHMDTGEYTTPIRPIQFMRQLTDTCNQIVSQLRAYY